MITSHIPTIPVTNSTIYFFISFKTSLHARNVVGLILVFPRDKIPLRLNLSPLFPLLIASIGVNFSIRFVLRYAASIIIIASRILDAACNNNVEFPALTTIVCVTCFNIILLNGMDMKNPATTPTMASTIYLPI